MDGIKKYTMFKSLRPHYKKLDKLAFLYTDKNLAEGDKSLYNSNVMAGIFWAFISLYNVQLLIKGIRDRHSTDELVDTLFLLLTTITAIVKQVMFTIRMKRIKQLFATTDGELFTPKNSGHLVLLEQNEKYMRRLHFMYVGTVLGTCVYMSLYPLGNKALGQDIKYLIYFPFDPQKSPILEILACSYFGIALTCQGYVNSIVDCTIVAFYGQCEVQLKLLRYDLEHLTDLDDVDLQDGIIDGNILPYIDNDLIKKRLVHCVKHHQKIIWFLNETQSLSNEFVTIQLSVVCWTICMSVYKLVTIDMFSGEFFSTMFYLNCMLMQFFMYCYHGSQVLIESEYIAESAYCSNWAEISPRLRRLLHIFMVCCTRPLIISVAKIVPINLESYIAVLRASYTLFTILHKS